jgi:hypothetical protein
LPEDALALAHTQNHLIALFKVRGQQLAVPQVPNMTEIRGAATQAALQRGPLLGIQTGRSPWAFTVAHSLQSVFLKSSDPPLYSAPIFAKKIGNLLATLAASQKQQAVQSMVIAPLIGAGDLLLNGNSHDVWICI